MDEANRAGLSRSDELKFAREPDCRTFEGALHFSGKRLSGLTLDIFIREDLLDRTCSSRKVYTSACRRFARQTKGREMTKRILPLLMTLLVAGIFTSPVAWAQQLSHTSLKVGDVAPDFSLRSDQGSTVKLSDYRGTKTVILAFYVLAFTGG
jgi:hypothetical protein